MECRKLEVPINFHPDYQYSHAKPDLAVVTDGRQILLISLQTGACLLHPKKLTHVILALDFTKDFLAVIHQDKILVWTVTNSEFRTISTDQIPTCLLIQPSLIFFGHLEGSISIYDLNDLHWVATCQYIPSPKKENKDGKKENIKFLSNFIDTDHCVFTLKHLGDSFAACYSTYITVWGAIEEEKDKKKEYDKEKEKDKEKDNEKDKEKEIEIGSNNYTCLRLINIKGRASNFVQFPNSIHFKVRMDDHPGQIWMWNYNKKSKKKKRY